MPKGKLRTISISKEYRDKFEKYWNSLPKNLRSAKVCEGFIKLMEDDEDIKKRLVRLEHKIMELDGVVINHAKG